MENDGKKPFVSALSSSGLPQNGSKGRQEILSSEFRKRFLSTVSTCLPLKESNYIQDNINTNVNTLKSQTGKIRIYKSFETGGDRETGEDRSQIPPDIEFENYLGQKYTKSRDFKIKSKEFKDIVVYVLVSLNIEPTMGNYRKYDPILDWLAICENDLKRKGIIE